MPRFVLKALPSSEKPLQSDLESNGQTLAELGDEERKFVLVTVPEGTSPESLDEILETVENTTRYPVLVVTEGVVVEVMEIKQVESAWERL